MTNIQIVVPADIYDYHELVSEAYGGVGWGMFYDANDAPCCIRGQRYFERSFLSIFNFPGSIELYSIQENDKAVTGLEIFEVSIRKLTKEQLAKRIPWSEYVKTRNIVRGN